MSKDKKIQKLKEIIAEYEKEIKNYEELFLADGKIDEKEQKKLDKINAAFEKIKQKIDKLEKRQALEEQKKLEKQEEAEEQKIENFDDILLKYKDIYKEIVKSINDMDKEDFKLSKEEEKEAKKVITKLDQLLHKFLNKYVKLDPEIQKKISEQKEEITALNDNVLLFKEKAITPIKDLSHQIANPEITALTKKTTPTLSKTQTNIIVDLFKTGSLGDIDQAADVHHNDVEQGFLGNCYFLSALGAAANADPSAIKELIKPSDKADGTYDVKLYVKDKKFFAWNGLHPVIINVSPDIPTEINRNTGKEEFVYASSGDKELWVALVEKAYAKLNGKKYKSKYKSIEGGYGTWGIEAVTGHEAKKFNPNRKSKEELVDIIQNALNEKRAITAATKFKLKKPNDRWVLSNKAEIYGLHEYYILEISMGDIKLHNPHKAREIYLGVDTFTIPLDDFLEYYNAISLEV
ncbi:MAG: Peptidase C2 calpain [uncultured Sulfurovum sp.]|uniref:Peptidase C2 calpain n=1 Tax=uncultured Sulfurovum sp. TaxID=269237 RepID=A0A6S6SIW1_9BACT|nr:MAG: Peptidase C2 calpain [uncultured Sulfurovum sp.]